MYLQGCRLRLLALTALLALALPALAEVNQKAIDEVAAGKLKVARASWWGFDPADSTTALQAAINSKVPKLIVDNVGGPWVVLPLSLVSDQEIEFEKGVEVLAKRGAYLDTNASLLTGSLVNNVVLSGYGATLRMWRDDYDKEPYKHAEWRHVINLHSCGNIKILGLTLTESGGDGIYLGTGKAGVTNKDILIRDVVCDKNYRQGISVITAENLLIENTMLSNTDGTAPRAGIDFEPNGPTERVVNCVMRNCVAQNNAGCGFVAYIPTLDATSAPVGLRLENCRAYGNAGPPACFMTGNTPAAAVKGKLELIDCKFHGRKQPGFILMGNPPTGLRVRVERCQFLDNAADAPTLSPILFEAQQSSSEDMGGVEFVDCLVRDPLGRKPMSFVDMTGGLRIADVTGNLILETDRKQTPVTITEALLAEWMPALKLKRLPRFSTEGVSFAPLNPPVAGKNYAATSGRQRNQAHFVLYAAEGDVVNLTLSHGQVGKYAGRASELVVTGPSGKQVARLPAPFMKDTDTSFTAPATGLYRLDADVSPNCLGITKCSHPLSLITAGEAVHFLASLGTYYFLVPAGTREFVVKVFGEGMGEGSKATLLKPGGEVFGSKDDIAQTYQFEVTRPEGAPAEVWSVKLERATNTHLEDHYLDLFGVPPFLALSPEGVLAPTK